jgi:PhzF family phenazine biosynthesis protein
MERDVALVDAFTDEPLSGNAAGVVVDAGDLSTDQMAAVARELSVSETAFVTDGGDDADRRVRFFTPTQEVDLCGHATIATHAHLRSTGAIDAGTHRMATDVGVLEVEVTDDGVVWMAQEEPSVSEVDVEYDDLGGALGVDPATMRDVGADLPVAVASTGLPFLVVPVNFLDAVGSVDPDDTAVEQLCDPYGAAGIYLFSFDALEAESTLHGRSFTAPVGIHEDPVTGTASGAVGAYLDRFGAFDRTPEEMVFEQGHYVDRPGRVRVRVGDDGPVRVGGTAVTALEGTLTIPDDDSGEILEA